jgi:nucleoside-diphosphate-sugar epimerase
VRRRALVTGATGVVGHFLLPRLVAAGWDVDAISRRAARGESAAGVHWHTLDMARDAGAVPATDVLFHAAPLWLAPALVAPLAQRGLRRVVAFGSTSRFTKQDAPSAASRTVAHALAEAEQQLAEACRAHDVAWTVFRPTLIYGAGLDRNLSSMARMIRRLGFFPLAGEGRGLRQPVYADDLALACLLAVDEPRTFGRAYDLTGGSTLPYREMAERIFAELGRRPRLPRLATGLLRAGLRAASLLPRLRHLGPEMADRMDRDQCFDSAAARDDFGYDPRPFDAELVWAGIRGG